MLLPATFMVGYLQCVARVAYVISRQPVGPAVSFMFLRILASADWTIGLISGFDSTMRMELSSLSLSRICIKMCNPSDKRLSSYGGSPIWCFTRHWFMRRSTLIQCATPSNCGKFLKLTLPLVARKRPNVQTFYLQRYDAVWLQCPG